MEYVREFMGPWRVTDILTDNKEVMLYGSGHEGVAVLLPGFAIIW